MNFNVGNKFYTRKSLELKLMNKLPHRTTDVHNQSLVYHFSKFQHYSHTQLPVCDIRGRNASSNIFEKFLDFINLYIFFSFVIKEGFYIPIKFLFQITFKFFIYIFSNGQLSNSNYIMERIREVFFFVRYLYFRCLHLIQ